MSAGKTVADAWDESQKLPPAQIKDMLNRWFTSDPSSWPVGAEKVAVATAISAIGVLAGAGLPLIFMPWLAPVIGALAEVTVDEINNFLSNFGLGSDTYCDHPEWRTQGMDDPLWIHYPGTVGVPAKGNQFVFLGDVPGPPYHYGGVRHQGWGRLGRAALTPDIRDYPWLANLESSLRIDFGKLVVLDLPDAAPGSFFDYWYRLYKRVKETNALQPCIFLTPGDADKQEEAILTSFVAYVWNPAHEETGRDLVFAGGANAGDDALLAPHANAIHINTGRARVIQNVAAGTYGGALGALNLQGNQIPAAVRTLQRAPTGGASAGGSLLDTTIAGVGVPEIAALAVGAALVYVATRGVPKSVARLGRR